MADKTEDPTPRKLREARERGQVARSIELNSALILLIVGVWIIPGPGSLLVKSLQSIIVSTISKIKPGMLVVEVTTTWLQQEYLGSLVILVLPLIEILVGIMVISVVANYMQTGLYIPSKRKFVDPDRVNPLRGIKRLFSLNGVVNLLKSTLKLVVVALVAYQFLVGKMDQIVLLSTMELKSGLSSWIGMATGLITRVGVSYFILAVADYIYQRWDYMRNLRMSKQDIMDEVKQTEGDPFVRGRIRQQQRRMAQMRMMANVPKSDVVVVNPTHLAIAIKYDEKENKAPVVLAKGADLVAARIIDIAKENNIEVVQNIPVARALYKSVEIEQEIPPEMYMAMAEILSFVFKKIKNR
ncbi:MAG: flagellar biosynthesis protein FlhB [Anaerolineaceae bacterium]|nr:flagellar biosynthesis protein FlhB [Anaerolineaceae bacterium]